MIFESTNTRSLIARVRNSFTGDLISNLCEITCVEILACDANVFVMDKVQGRQRRIYNVAYRVSKTLLWTTLVVLLLVIPTIRRSTVIPVMDRRRRNRIMVLGAKRLGSLLSTAALSSTVLIEDQAAACDNSPIHPKI